MLGVVFSSWIGYNSFMGELDWQDNTVIPALRDSGAKVQRFSDEMAIGIPDLFAGDAKLGMWIEVKWSRVPMTLAGSLKYVLKGPQHFFLRQWYMRPNLSAMLVGVNEGSWCVVPTPCIDWFVAQTWGTLDLWFEEQLGSAPKWDRVLLNYYKNLKDMPR